MTLIQMGNRTGSRYLQNAPLSSGNAFLYENRLTEYTGDRLFNGPIGRGNVFIGSLDENGAISFTEPYPREVTNGTLTVQFYGGSNPNTVLLHPYFVSQDASTLTNRASWVKPPYISEPTEVEPGPKEPPCATICFASPEYYLRNVERLPRGIVLIAGGSSISTSNSTAMRLALADGASAHHQFNREFVAAQLSLLASPGPDVGALRGRLACYGINIATVPLEPDATLGKLIEYARQTARSGGTEDLKALANILAQLNGTCRR